VITLTRGEGWGFTVEAVAFSHKKRGSKSVIPETYTHVKGTVRRLGLDICSHLDNLVWVVSTWMV
jgi:hypothetical protein